jgi:hypothetical protein
MRFVHSLITVSHSLLAPCSLLCPYTGGSLESKRIRRRNSVKKRRSFLLPLLVRRLRARATTPTNPLPPRMADVCRRHVPERSVSEDSLASGNSPAPRASRWLSATPSRLFILGHSSVARHGCWIGVWRAAKHLHIFSPTRWQSFRAGVFRRCHRAVDTQLLVVILCPLSRVSYRASRRIPGFASQPDGDSDILLPLPRWRH